MATSLLFLSDAMAPSIPISTSSKHPNPQSSLLTTATATPSLHDNHINSWLTQQYSQKSYTQHSPNSSMSRSNMSNINTSFNHPHPHQSVDEDVAAGEYTITTQGPSEPLHPDFLGSIWPSANSYSNSGLQLNHTHPSMSPLSTGTSFSDNWSDLSGFSPVPDQLPSYMLPQQYHHHDQSLYAMPRTPSQLSAAGSDQSLSPLYPSSPSLPTPTTPNSSYSASPGANLLILDQGQGSSSANPDRDLFTHRQQLSMFRDAMTLPMDGAGPFIPQQMYKPHTTSDRKRYVEEVLLEAPLYFYSEHSTQCGILLKDALQSRTKKLRDRDQVVFEGRGPSVSIRLEWPGYRQWSRQIPTKDFRSPPGPITLAKLAKNVAKCVQRFMQDRKSLPMEDEADQQWRIGDRADDIKLEDLVLVSVHHVSLGSWQPQLRLVRPRQLQRLGQGMAGGAGRGGAMAGHGRAVLPAPLQLPPTPISTTTTSPPSLSPAHAYPRLT